MTKDGPITIFSPEQTAQLAAKLQPTRFMPIHWGAYPLPCIRGMSLYLKAYQWQEHWA